MQGTQLVLAWVDLLHKQGWNISLSLYVLALMLVHCHGFYSSTDLWGTGRVGKSSMNLAVICLLLFTPIRAQMLLLALVIVVILKLYLSQL